MTDKTILITGANSGIGYETARALYMAGAHVILACRTSDKADETRYRLQSSSAPGRLETGVLELADIQLQAIVSTYTAVNGCIAEDLNTVSKPLQSNRNKGMDRMGLLREMKKHRSLDLSVLNTGSQK